MEEQEKDTVKENEKNKDEDETIEVIDPEDAAETAEEQEAEEDPLNEEIARLAQEKSELEQRVLRVQAEFENFKKRTRKDKEAASKYKSQDLVNELLPAMDNLDRALKMETTEANSGLVEGIRMVQNQLQDALKSQGVTEIEAVEKEFDPNLHHAVMQVEDETQESNMVVEELQKGYMLKDRVIRPAMVKVNK
ncbi:nucleotide exchange factor GrpE [Lentibacillus sediminis]|uniref:nucleotide exchange factor GrpE n=1 Tax=Lentibacillus sediminis TaxID=1940529 RepID=UPI000C1C5E1F|nr:nucleotide exchange factor GrpE [Lentibacillus sediminis]